MGPSPMRHLNAVIFRRQSIWDLAALVQEMPEYSPSASASEVSSGAFRVMEKEKDGWSLFIDIIYIYTYVCNVCM
jgi:hypothetical protein